MSKLGDAKTMGGIGAILLLIPGVSIVGYILILIATKYISDGIGDKSIFDNMLYAVVAGIIGVAAGAFIIFTGAIFGIFTFAMSAIGGVIAGLAVAWIALIVSSIFIRRAYDTMATKLNVGMFRTAGLLYFIGAILTIVLIGFVILLVAAILQIIAYFSIQEAAQGAQPQPMPQPTAQTAQPGMKFCPSCGTQLASSATFCSKCGAQQP
ncbi:MAG TPA: DUF996 domain-containing protein [Nitrososphaerales archaeon]|nr:DUF996 domain-containing protein [Nitrososphaerales archaeon]